MRRVFLIYNPAAGRHSADRLVAPIEKLVEQRGFAVDTSATRGPGDAERLARAAAQDGAWAVFACGGDGCLRECAAGILGSPTALGFIPSGTANVMARALGIPRQGLAAAYALVQGKRVSFDIGLCNEHPFLMQASVGIDAEILRRVKPSRKRTLGRAEIARAAFSGWHSYSYPKFDVRSEGSRRTVSFAAVCNIPFYGGGWRMAPEARWDDRLLDLVLLKSGSRATTLGFARDLGLGRHLRRSDVECARVEEAAISSVPGLNVQLDGDLVPEALPARVRLAAQRVRFLVPS